MKNNADIYDYLFELITKIFSMPEDKVSEKSFIYGDIFVEDIDVLELVLNIENEFDISVDSDLITRKTTVGDLVNIIANLR